MATSNLSDYNSESVPNGEGFKIGIVVSEWNKDITENLYNGAYETLVENGVNPSDIIRLNVPGSFELIYASKLMIQTTNVDAVIALGSVIRGETPHFEFVCDAVAQGTKDINLNFETPVIFGLLTDDSYDQAVARSGGDKGNKGVECAVAALKMAALNQVMMQDEDYDSDDIDFDNL
ncbi:MAG: 6,7-dimethyl-8-ribityllumazine synthase [Flavobacteriales bacterium]|jgi:6,7-dimethyl-8-ribityllumazine synthase|nr:6,7-dimethyl-8-ribityllumazine synthase [Flavobacteriales bacterium]